jgi:hypothetical protein
MPGGGAVFQPIRLAVKPAGVQFVNRLYTSRM